MEAAGSEVAMLRDPRHAARSTAVMDSLLPTGAGSGGGPQARDIHQEGVDPRPGFVSALPPVPDGG